MGGDEEMKTSTGKCGHLLVIDPVNHKDWGLTRSSSNTQKIILR